MNQSLLCRACGQGDLQLILSLGRTPLANALLTEAKLNLPEPRYPLDVVYCHSCTLVQITETVPRSTLFQNYLYFSSFADTVVDNARDIVERLIATRSLSNDNLVLEIASNDGYLLQHYLQHNVPVLGIEPAENIAEVAQSQGIPTINDFFGKRLARELSVEGPVADIIHANNVLAHVDDLNGVVAGLGLLLKPDGLAVIEVPYVKDLIDHIEFDTIYHEHLCYFSLTALDRLFNRHGLIIADVEHLPIHGGSLRLFVRHQICCEPVWWALPKDGVVSKVDRPQLTTVPQMLAAERDWGVDQYGFYRDFGNQVERLRGKLVNLLQRLKAAGNRLAVYGASAKGTTLLNYFQIGREMLDFVADRSTVKQGHYTPGTHLPVVAPETLLRERPDYVLLLTWNFADEILAQQRDYRRGGGQFIIPIPDVRVVS